MKKLSLFAFAALACIVISCNNSDSDLDLDNDINGTWYVTSKTNSNGDKLDTGSDKLTFSDYTTASGTIDNKTVNGTFRYNANQLIIYSSDTIVLSYVYKTSNLWLCDLTYKNTTERVLLSTSK
jgi:hypothetical protein